MPKGSQGIQGAIVWAAEQTGMLSTQPWLSDDQENSRRDEYGSKWTSGWGRCRKEGIEEEKKKKENVVSKNLHLPHPDQHVSLSGVRAEMRLVKLPCVSILGCLAFVWGRKRWRGHSLAQGERTAKQRVCIESVGGMPWSCSAGVFTLVKVTIVRICRFLGQKKALQDDFIPQGPFHRGVWRE